MRIIFTRKLFIFKSTHQRLIEVKASLSRLYLDRELMQKPSGSNLKTMQRLTLLFHSQFLLCWKFATPSAQSLTGTSNPGRLSCLRRSEHPEKGKAWLKHLICALQIMAKIDLGQHKDRKLDVEPMWTEKICWDYLNSGVEGNVIVVHWL